MAFLTVISVTLSVFSPSPWEIFTYDANDNAGRTHNASSSSYRHHWNTPGSVIHDALGRVVVSIERNRAVPQQPADPLPPMEGYRTSSRFDIRGNLLTVIDPFGREAFNYVYDCASDAHLLRIESIDAGWHTFVLDAAGNKVEQRDMRGALILRLYDELTRPSSVWGRDGMGKPLTLRGRHLYGDDPNNGLSASARNAANLTGKLYQQYDEAGLLTFEAYDFKGNLLQKARRTISDAALLGLWNAPPPDWAIERFQVDWDSAASPPLEPVGNAYTTTMRYDALNRFKSIQYPADVTGARKTLLPLYNRAGRLEQVSCDGDVYVRRIAYNTKGQRVMIVYGNDIMTRYAYDPLTFRLARLMTQRYSEPASLTYRPGGGVLQDIAYTYDLTGNVLAIEDHAPGSGVTTQPDRMRSEFDYDPLYRLMLATGRECYTSPPSPPWGDVFRCDDVTRTRLYSETYTYNRLSNITQMRHVAGATGNFTRTYAVDPNSNRLTSLTVGTNPAYFYGYDACGNLTAEGTARHFEWDHLNRLCVYRTQTAGSAPTLYALSLYDVSGQRVKKLVSAGANYWEVTVTIDGLFEYHHVFRPGEDRENNTLHIMDEQSRIATLRVGTAFSDDGTAAFPAKYHLANHLGSSSIVVGGASASGNTFISREDYTAYGETSFGSYARKRYRFTGKERDEGSSLYYHGARYYAPWLMRWTSCDPEWARDSLNLYLYVRGNPIRYQDKTGRLLGEAALFEGVVSGGGAAGGGAAAGGAAVGGMVVLAAAAIVLNVVLWSEVYKLHKEVKEAEARAEALRRSVDRSREQLDQIVKIAWMNGEITDDAYLTYRNTGSLPSGFYTDLRKESGINFRFPQMNKQAPAKKDGPIAPPIVMGDVKSLDSYYQGIRHLSEMEGRGIYNVNGNTALALYNPATGEVYLQIFGPRVGNNPREIIWEGIIGKIEIPDKPPVVRGNEVEDAVRKLVEEATGQKFKDKASNAHGPDLVPEQPPPPPNGESK